MSGSSHAFSDMNTVTMRPAFEPSRPTLRRCFPTTSSVGYYMARRRRPQPSGEELRSKSIARSAIIAVASVALAVSTPLSANAGPIKTYFYAGGVACENGVPYQSGTIVNRESSVATAKITVITGDESRPSSSHEYNFTLAPNGRGSVRIPVPSGQPYAVWQGMNTLDGTVPVGWAHFSAVTCSSAGATLAQRFSDVPPEMQFFAEMTWLADQGVSTGWDTGNGIREYRPLEPVNRDAMAAFMYRLAGSPEFTAPSTSPFSDVATDNQFYKEITWLSDQGISTGWDTGNGTREFRPVTPINRDAMAAFMYRFAGSSQSQIPAIATFAAAAPVFTDVPADSQFANEISWMSTSGISKGWDDSTYRPLEPVARDAMAAFMLRFANLTAHTLDEPGTIYLDALPLSQHPTWDGNNPLEGAYDDESSPYSYYRLDGGNVPGTTLSITVVGSDNSWVDLAILSTDGRLLAEASVPGSNHEALLVPADAAALRIHRANDCTWSIARM